MAIQPLNQSVQRLTKLTGVAAFIAAATILPGCANDTAVDEAAVDETVTAEAENVQAGDISDELERFEGTTVTVREEIEEVVGDYAFFLDEDEFFGGEQLLVINASGTPIEVPADDDVEVQVTGEVRELIIADINAEYGVDLDPTLFADYEQQPVIVADSATLAPDPAEVTSDPEQYYGQRLAIAGDVESTLSPNTILLDEDALFGGEDLLVISPEDTVTTGDDDEVVITGVLRPYVAAEFEQDYELGWDLDFQEQIEADYSEEPVFVADGIYPSAM